MAAIAVETMVLAPVEAVWERWTTPEHITRWNAALDTWHSPQASNDLRPGGRFTYRMEAKDGSMGFDYSGTYTEVYPFKLLAFTLDDERKVVINFSTLPDGTRVSEVFETENENPSEMQRTGWQAILNNFKRYCEE